MKHLSNFTILCFIGLMVVGIIVMSCTKNQMTRNWGGSETVELPFGEKLVNATWKESNLWILTEQMDSSYVPQIKMFRESSSRGLFEGKVVFIERKIESVSK